jgi:hypothetical protein
MQNKDSGGMSTTFSARCIFEVSSYANGGRELRNVVGSLGELSGQSTGLARQRLNLQIDVRRNGQTHLEYHVSQKCSERTPREYSVAQEQRECQVKNTPHKHMQATRDPLPPASKRPLVLVPAAAETPRAAR